MRNYVSAFTDHLKESKEIGLKTDFNIQSNSIDKVLVTGLGGSGIGGTIVSDLVRSFCNVPVLTNKGYDIPAYVDERTLVIASSYSGNTEETLMALAKAEEKGAQIACITSGGKLKDLAGEKGYNVIVIPGGFPPRAAFGYSSLQSLFVLEKYGLITDDFVGEIDSSIALLEQEAEKIQGLAKQVADGLYEKIPVIYAEEAFGGVAVRFRQQINENSKMLCWHHVIPEMNHNELVGWAGSPSQVAPVFLRSDLEFERNTTRIKINQEIIEKRADVIEIWAKGKSLLEQSYYLIHLTDWVSVYLADLKQIDAVEVDVITHLKGTLAKS